jgi:hypothetical protein
LARASWREATRGSGIRLLPKSGAQRLFNLRGCSFIAKALRRGAHGSGQRLLFSQSVRASRALRDVRKRLAADRSFEQLRPRHA